MEQIMAQIKFMLKVGYDEIKLKMKARQERMMAIMMAGLAEIKSVAEHQEVSKEESSVEAIGAPGDRYGDRHLVVGRRRQPKKRTQGDGGSRKKPAAVRSRVNRHAFPARRKGLGQKDRHSRKKEGKSGPRTVLYEEPLKDERSKRDDGRS
jgi:hypothetical protein